MLSALRIKERSAIKEHVIGNLDSRIQHVIAK
jgi:hypothetical protein